MAEGSTSQGVTNSIPPPPSLTGFSFHTIGKQPELLKRINDAAPGSNGTGQYDFSPSPSPDLEEQLLMPSESSPGNSDAQQHPPKRNRLLDALAPDVDVEMGVVDDDVNLNVGASPGPKQMASSTPLISRLHYGSTSTTSQSSHGHVFATPHNASSQPSSVSDQNKAVKNSSAEHGTAVHLANAGFALSTSSASAFSTRPTHHPSVPPTPPPEIDGPSGSSAPRTVTPYESMRTVQARLQSLLDTGLASSEDFNAIRELAQVAKVESTSVSVASQKAVTLAQKALAAAQDAMSASQDCVKVSHAAKARWEAAIQGCEKFMEQRSSKIKQQQDAFKKELTSLGENIKALEEADRKRAAQRAAERKALEQQQAQQVAATALQQAPASGSTPSSSVPAPAPNGASAPVHPVQPAVPVAEHHDDIARQYVLADEFARLRHEVEELRKLAQDRNREDSTKPEEDPQKKTLGPEQKRKQEDPKQQPRHAKQEPEPEQQAPRPRQPTQLQSVLIPLQPPLPHRKPQQALQPAKPTTDPQTLERELKEKLKTHKKSSVSASSSSLISSAGPSTPTLPQNGYMGPASQHSPIPASSSLPNLKREATHPKTAPAKVKAEALEDEIPPAPPLPHRKAPSVLSMQLEYPPSSIPSSLSFPAQPRPPNPLALRIPQRGIVPSPVRNRVASGAESEDSPIHIHRQGSDPGNLPIIFPSSSSLTMETPPHLATSLSSMASGPFSADGVKPEPIEDKAPPPPGARTSVVHPPIATLSVGPSPVESSTSSSISTSAPSISNASQHATRKNKGKGKAHRVTSSTSNVSRPPPFAQLPPKPINGLGPTQNSQPGPAGSNSVPPSPQNPASTTTQHRSQPQTPTSASASRGPGNDPRRAAPASSRPLLSNSDRSYVPARSPSPAPANHRSRSPGLRQRNISRLQPRGDHYSPGRGRRRSASPRRSPPPRSHSRSGSPARSGFAGRRPARSPPPHARRVMQPYRRPQSPDHGAPTAGVKRPHEDANNSTAPPPIRRRVEERHLREPASGPPSQHQGHESPYQQWVEEWSLNAQYSGSPGSSTRPRQQQTVDGDRGRAKLASRLSDARAVPESQAPQLPRQGHVQLQQLNNNPPSRVGSPTMESSSGAPSLLQRFGGGGGHQAPRNPAPNSRGSRGTHRGGRGRGGSGGGGGAQSHQSLNNRISESSGTVSLLQRIDQG
ncbi:hypothetical protein FA13DRAFT_1725917 [Coprinellus micaceus]|uniref:Uncharacterized protein n=1 Tax=Coprinellus micaceus TaxID=71717 RepID=A0A4Y7TVR1_COPMI|nr:hypothetical protein FA13DRAFT_1725917 [Coprinellus micaceus]